MQLTSEIRTSLKREYNLCVNAVNFYKKSIKDFERKYHLSTDVFQKKFESGQLGDESDYFDWYAFAQLLDRWQKIRTAIHSTVR